jgi:hypothetical protein
MAIEPGVKLPGLQYQSEPGVGSEVRNFSVAAQAVAAASREQIIGTLLQIPPGGLKVGSKLKFAFDVTKTAAGTAASTIDISFGTAGTVADTARVSLPKALGTAAVDEGKFVVEAIVRSVSATGVVVGVLTGTHRLAVTGINVLPVQETTISSGFDNTPETLDPGYIALNITTGASDAYTIQFAEASLSGV